MINTIIDTDPGVDDALAITLACFAPLNLVGITTVYGNTDIKNATRNALTILQIIKKKIPVYEGVSSPIFGKNTLASSHGNNGLGGFSIKILRQKKRKKSALIYLVKLLSRSRDKSIDIVCIGPLSNISLLNSLDPSCSKKIRRLIILGGVFGQKGNITPFSEFNVYNDPYALRNVLTMECKKILIPINICRKVIFNGADFENITNKRLSRSLNKIAEMYINYYMFGRPEGNFAGGVMYDVLAISYVLNPRLFKTKKTFVEVELKSKEKIGYTTMRKKGYNCNVVIDVDAEKVKRLFFSTINENAS